MSSAKRRASTSVAYTWEMEGTTLERCARVESRRVELQEAMAEEASERSSPDSPHMRTLLKEWMALLHARNDLNVALLKEASVTRGEMKGGGMRRGGGGGGGRRGGRGRGWGVGGKTSTLPC